MRYILERMRKAVDAADMDMEGGDCFFVFSNMYHGDQASSQANTEYGRDRGRVISPPPHYKSRGGDQASNQCIEHLNHILLLQIIGEVTYAGFQPSTNL